MSYQQGDHARIGGPSDVARRKTYVGLCAEITAATELALSALEAHMIALQRRVKPLLERIHPRTEA